MKVQKQVSAFLINKPGRLANVCASLAKHKVDILALTVMDTKEHGVLRMVTSDPDATTRMLRDTGTPYTETDVLLVDTSHRPGALARVCEKLANQHVNIDYAYCSAGVPGRKALGVFKVSSIAKATKVLGPLDGNSVPKKGKRKKTAPVRRKVTSGPRR